MATELLTRAQLPARTTLSESTIKRLRRSGKFPSPIRMSPGRIVWIEGDIASWLESNRANDNGGAA